MRIGIVCYPTFGGSGVVATELGKALATKGHQVHFITYNQPQRLDFLNENLFFHEVRFQHYPLFEYPPYETALTSKMVDVVKNENLEILHVHYAIPHASAAYLAQQILKSEGIFIPFITTLHGTDITLVGKDASYEPVVTFSINQSDGVTAVSADLAKDTKHLFKITREIEVIPNFIEKLLAHTSNFRKVKRIEDVLAVFALVRNQIPAKLLLVGDGPERQRMENLCRELGIYADVRFLGKLDAVEELLSVCDVFVMPSEKESFGLAALEAMACEVPVISSNTGGLPELNIQGVTGFLSDVGDVTDMAEKALFILKDENLPRFKEAALARAKEFEIGQILPMYERYYEAVLAKSMYTSV